MLKIFTLFFFYSCLISCTPKVLQDVQSTDSETPPSFDTLRQSPISGSEKLLFTIPVTAKYFTIDKLNQLYLVTDRNEVIKYDSKGKEVFRYNNNFLENLELVDATNPFNILLYYPDYLSIITVDRTMTEVGAFDLSALNLIQVKAIGSSNDNNIWIYDEVAFKLKKVNRSGMTIKQSVDINLQLGFSPQPTFLIERENNVYVNDPRYGIVVFTNFGEYDSVLDLKGIEKFQVFNNRLVYKIGTQLFSYHLQSFNQKEILLPVAINASDDVLIGKNQIFIRKENQIEVYTFGKEKTDKKQ